MLVIGAGRIGQAFKSLDDKIVLIDRENNWDQLENHKSDLILIASRNDDLESILAKIPGDQLANVVFLQNGMLSPWLETKKLHKNTRAILYFAVAKRGDKPQVGEDKSIVCGERATELVQWMNQHGIPAEEVSDERLKQIEMEKLIWNSAFGLLCDYYKLNVGQVLDQQLDSFKQIVTEMHSLAEEVLGLGIGLESLMESLINYTRSVNDYQASTKEWNWRIGWFVENSNSNNEHCLQMRKFLNDLGY